MTDDVRSFRGDGLDREPGRGLPAFEPLEARLLLNGQVPEFATPLADKYVIPAAGGGLTIGVDGYDADSDTLTLAAESGSPDLTVFIPTGNRYARLRFVSSDGVTPIGEILVQLLEGRSAPATGGPP